MKTTYLKVLLTTVSLIVSASGFRGEVSGAGGLYKSQSRKLDGVKADTATSFEIEARYAEPYEDDLYYFSDIGVYLRSYDAEAGFTSPSSSTGIILGAGGRWHLPLMNEFWAPIILARVFYSNDSVGVVGTGGEIGKNGIYYSGAVALRLTLIQGYFIDFESELFESALFATEKNTTGGVEVETSKFELYASTEKDFDLKLRFGISF